MLIQEIPITEINPAPYNPRKDLKPGDREYEKLKKSIKEFDLVEPLVWNKRTGNLVGGHQRFKIIRDELGHDKTQVTVVDLDDKKEKALNVALNKISGDWDFVKLKDLLVELDDGEFDLSLTGFDELELKELIDHEGKAGLTEDDEIPETQKEAIAKKGDLYILGNHRLLCADSTNVDDLNRLLDGLKADMVFTDPPYNTGMEKRSGSARLNHFFNDKYTPEEWDSFLAAMINNLVSATKSEAAIYVCIDWRRVGEMKMYMEESLKVSNVIVWDKMVHGLGSDYKHTYEHIIVGKKGSPRINSHVGEDYRDIWHLQRRVGKNEDHATAKPIELCSKPILHASKQDDIVLDLFGGSGSTLIAAEKLNRRCFMMEVVPNYCDVIVKRWENFTGKKAVLNRSEIGVC